MPWATTLRPSLSLGTLSAIVEGQGYPCDVLYPNLLLSSLVGLKSYEVIAETPSYFGMAEHLFAIEIFGQERLGSDDYLRKLSRTWASENKQGWHSFERLVDLRTLVPKFLSMVAEEILERSPTIVGFTCTFNQVLSSVALAKQLKEMSPSVEVILGGPCVHGEVGVSYSRIFQPFVDYVFLGEADELLPEFVARKHTGRSCESLTGLAVGGRRQGDAALVRDLDALPIPDYSSYFSARRQLVELGFKLGDVHSVPFEASRGCWWGQKHHCTFCGLNTGGMSFRRKSAARVAREIANLSARYECNNLMAADNILDFRAYQDLLPTLASATHRPHLFFEIKANVSRDDVAGLAAAGVSWVQPGFESFSDHVLKLMKKGTTTLQNVATLKWLSEFGIKVSYNLLVGFPGESVEDFIDILRVIGFLHHLSAPGSEAHMVQVQRFAPFHFAAEQFGFASLRACEFYKRLIPEELAAPEEYAYFFERDIPRDSPVLQFLPMLNNALQEWNACGTRLSLRRADGHLQLILTDHATCSVTDLTPLDSAILLAVDKPTGSQGLASQLAGIGTSDEIRAAALSLERRGLLLHIANRLLSVVPFERPLDANSVARLLDEFKARTIVREGGSRC